MRTNFIQYSVQDRDYKKGEVLSLINDEPYKHYVLAGSKTTNWATTLEWASPVPKAIGNLLWWTVSTVASVGCSITKAVAIKAGMDWLNPFKFLNEIATVIGFPKLFGNSNSDIYIIENNTTNNYINEDVKYKITDLNQGSYTGREVTKFLNEYYDGSILPGNKVHYQNVLGDFLDHAYRDAEVPTLGEQSWYDFSSIAVLDAI